MRFWKRIVLYSMILFMVIFNGVGVLLIEYLHSNNVKNVISSTLFQCDGIVSAIYLNSDNKDNPAGEFNTFIKSYLSFENQGLSNIEIYGGNEKLITSKYEVEYKGERPEVKDAKVDEKKFLIRNIGINKYLFVSQSIKISNNIYRIIVSKNINSIFEERVGIYKVFLILDIITAIVLSIGMYFIAKKITKPIEILTKTSIEVSNGNYEKRVEIKNKDEVGLLSDNFNKMLDTLQNNIKELNDLGESRQRFIDNLTHESKTPITSILGYSELLLKRNTTSEMRFKALNYINSEAKRLEELNSTLLKLTLLKNQNVDLRQVNIKEVVNDSVKALNYILSSKDININLNVSKKYFLCDRKLLTILVINIIENSVKASSINSSITINSTEENGEYILEVIDTGIGISKEDINKIKEPFYIADKSRSKKNNGLGLGLSICEEICKMFNIKLNIHSKVNEGTTILLIFKGE